MGLFLKLFSTTAEYNAYTADTVNFIKPNVSLIEENMGVCYNPYAEPIDARLVVTYNVEDASNPTPLYFYNTEAQAIGVDMFDKVEIDGTEVSVADLDTNNGSYQLSVGEHTVKYTLKDPTIIGAVQVDESTFKVGAVFMQCNAITNVTIPNSVTSIGASAFSDCLGLTSIDIPNGATSIAGGAFDGTPWWSTYSADTSHHYGSIIYINDVAYQATATTITNCEFKEGTISIGERAFNSCTNLTSVTIPNSVTSIGGGAFRQCTSLTNIVIPSGVTSIGGSTFYECRGLASITIPDSVTNIGGGAFGFCTSLTSIVIPNNVTSIGGFAFSSCESLTSVTIGSGVTTIGERAFNDCQSLTSVTIPASVTSIGASTFYYCTSLRSIVSNAMTAPTISNNTFQDIKTGGTLTVPTGSSGYDVWMGTGNYYLGKYNWTKVEQ